VFASAEAEAFRQADIINGRAAPEAGAQTALFLQLSCHWRSVALCSSFTIFIAQPPAFVPWRLSALRPTMGEIFFTRGHAARQIVVFIGLVKTRSSKQRERITRALVCHLSSRPALVGVLHLVMRFKNFLGLVPEIDINKAEIAARVGKPGLFQRAAQQAKVARGGLCGLA
jgi:hypothetical protein